jgi:hypothetical protein
MSGKIRIGLDLLNLTALTDDVPSVFCNVPSTKIKGVHTRNGRCSRNRSGRMIACTIQDRWHVDIFTLNYGSRSPNQVDVNY